MNPFISVIVPLYNEEPVLKEMHRRLKEVLQGARLDYEMILVNDGSRDATPEIARMFCRGDKRVKLLSFSRNFGHQMAITAGMDRASGQVVVIIDADLQDPPEIILEMIEKWKEGYQVVYGVRSKRKGESAFKLATAAIFYRILRRMTAVDIPLDTGDFRLMDRQVVEHLRRMRERSRFVRGMVSWVGFKQGRVEYTRQRRLAGETKYPFKKMLRFAVDGVLSFSQIPLKLASVFGLFCSVASFAAIAYGLTMKLFFPQTTIHGWTSIFVASLFIGGVQLMSIGVLGEYIGRMYEEIKCRPLYIIEEAANFDVDDGQVDEIRSNETRETATRRSQAGVSRSS